MRKLRTRQHFIEDLGINHVERQVLNARCTLHKYQSDYGYDADIHTYKNNGEVENGKISIQLKSTDRIKVVKGEKGFAFDLNKRDLELWLTNILPVIFVLYDAEKEIAYYIELTNYFREKRLSLKEVKKYIRVYIPKENVFSPIDVKQFRKIKNRIYGIYGRL